MTFVYIVLLVGASLLTGSVVAAEVMPGEQGGFVFLGVVGTLLVVLSSVAVDDE